MGWPDDFHTWVRHAGEKYVCAGCIQDDGLKPYVEAHVCHSQCSYCGKTSDGEIAANINNVTVFIFESLMTEYGLAIESLVYESAEGGYQGPITDFDDVLRYSGELEVDNEELMEDILQAMPEEPIFSKDLFHDETGELQSAWDTFAKQIMHEQRYVFFRTKTVEDHKYSFDRQEEPHTILESLGGIVRELEMVRTLAPETIVYRGREHPEEKHYTSAADLGVPPKERASQSRMSGAGIPVFYGALDAETTQMEVESDDPARAIVTIGTFRTLRSLNVLDLADPIEGVSIFDAQRRHQRSARAFLREFRADISKPIQKDNRIHIEYVPTQVVAEYFRHVFVDEDQSQLDGILYPSTRNDNGVCCVLFLSAVECVDAPAPDKTLHLLQVARRPKRTGK